MLFAHMQLGGHADDLTNQLYKTEGLYILRQYLYDKD